MIPGCQVFFFLFFVFNSLTANDFGLKEVQPGIVGLLWARQRAKGLFTQCLL